MKKLFYLIIPALVLVSCGDDKKKQEAATQAATPAKITPVSVPKYSQQPSMPILKYRRR